jgi:hypothetical protein
LGTGEKSAQLDHRRADADDRGFRAQFSHDPSVVVKRDWKKDRAKAVRHARLIAKRPELREALYGTPRLDLGADSLLPDRRAAKSRETAQKET